MSWKKYVLGDILKRKRTPEKIDPEKEYKLVTIKLYHKGVIPRSIVKGATIKSPMSSIRSGDFVLSGIDARNGAFGIVPNELNGAVITNDFWCIEPDETKISKDFFLYITTTPFFDYICNQSSDGTTQRIRLQKDRFFNYEIELPNIEAQKEILKQLNFISDKKGELTSELTHQLDLVKQLRQSFLREAMQGKLVKSTNTKETGLQLLEKIKAEKAHLIAEKKLKKEKPLAASTDEEIPFQIPEHWAWCRLGEIIYLTEGGKSPNCSNQKVKNEEWGVIKTTAVQEMIFLQDENKVLPLTFKVSEQHIIYEGDVIITRAGPKNRVGIVCCVENLSNNLILSDKTIRIKFSKQLLAPQFIALVLNSPLIKPYIERKMTGMADSQVNISQDNMKGFPIPLPPLEEQKQIVAKLKELMTFCDGLEQSIKGSQGFNEKLLQQVLREALEA